MRFIQNFSLRQETGKELSSRPEGGLFARSLHWTGGRPVHYGNTSDFRPSYSSDTIPLRWHLNSWANVQNHELFVWVHRALPSDLGSEGGRGLCVGFWKGALQWPALKRRGPKKPKVEARRLPPPASLEYGQSSFRMPVFNATTNGACDAGFRETNSV